MQSVPLAVWCWFASKALELGSILTFYLGNCAIQEETISLHYAAVIIAILWLVPNFAVLFVLFPKVFEAQFVDGVACFPDDNNTVLIEARHTFTAIWATAGGHVPMTISITVPIICFCYNKKKIVTEDTQYRKAMAKLSLFLVLGSAINLAGQVIPCTLSYYIEAPRVY